MHKSSALNMKRFIGKYLNPDDTLEILDVGSAVVNVKHPNYKPMFDAHENWTYVGMDVEIGLNVDIAVKDPYHWESDIASNSFDVVVSGQAFEHIKFPWLTIEQIGRVLKPNGICCIIAPSAGPIHRFPVDCYRYYPDGLDALAEWAGLTPIETYRHDKVFDGLPPNPKWQDCVLIARKVAS